MNITVIYGQRHKGNTWSLTHMFLERLSKEDNKITEFFLPDSSLGYCVGCMNCIMKDEKNCPHADIMQTIVTALDKADLIIISSPCYVFGMTGQLKVLFDHLSYRYMAHRPETSMFYKQAIAFSTAAGAGMNKVTKDIAFNLFMWGVARVYKLGVRVYAPNFDSIPAKRKQKIKRSVDRIACKVMKNHCRMKAGIKTRFIFNIMRLNQKKNDWNLADKEYWERHGWLDRKRPYKGDTAN